MRLPFYNQKTTTSELAPEFVEIRNLHKVYKSSQQDFIGLHELSVQIKQNTFSAFVGRSGSGKSTLINCLTGIDRPTAGEIYVDYTPVHKLNEFQLARWRGQQVGLVFQFFQLLPTLTMVENVILPMELTNAFPIHKRHKRAMELLDLVGLAQHANKLPSRTSGGQQQRVAIARALANDPAILVCDEPTGNLDISNAREMYKLFRSLCGNGKTVVVVTHDEELALQADNVFLIESGHLVNKYVSDSLNVLSDSQVTEFIKHAHIYDYEHGELIIKEGTTGSKFFVIIEGSVDVIVKRGERDIRLKTLSRGSTFGEMALLNDTNRAATIRAQGNELTKLAAIDRQKFLQLIDESPSFSEHMTHLIEKYEQHQPDFKTEQFESIDL